MCIRPFVLHATLGIFHQMYTWAGSLWQLVYCLVCCMLSVMYACSVLNINSSPPPLSPTLTSSLYSHQILPPPTPTLPPSHLSLLPSLGTNTNYNYNSSSNSRGVWSTERTVTQTHHPQVPFWIRLAQSRANQNQECQVGTHTLQLEITQSSNTR